MNKIQTPFYIFLLTSVLCIAEVAFAQTTGITSGAIYTIRSKSSSKLVNVSNASMANSANVDSWTDTQSDAERWIITYIGNNLYTLASASSGKLLHIANDVPANGVNVDQHDDTGNNSVKWAITDAGGGFYAIKSAANTAFILDLNAGDTTNGTNIQAWQSNNSDPQKWSFQEVTAQAAAPTSAIADKVFEAWSTGYDIVNDNGFWGTAEMMEIVLDAYEVTGKIKYRNMFDQMYLNFVKNHGEDWMSNNFNDDITWISIACVRSYLLSGNVTHLNKAKDQFDKMYARANTSSYGGGLLWYVGQTGKNSCINGPAMVACCYLAEATGDTTYYTKATYLYNWSKLYLFNENTGKVNDSYDGTIGDWSSTYNQGTYLGASVMLYNHTKDPSYLTIANRIAQYTKVTMYNSGVMNNEEGGNDLPGFKGIFMRYARRYVVDCNRTDYIPWLQLNARVAYNNRNTKNIVTTQWATRTPELNTANNFSASTAVSLLINCPYTTSLVRDAYKTIESENFDYLKGVIVEPCPEGTSNLGGVQNNYYTGYNNVEFGTKGAAFASIRLSSLVAGNTIEIHLGSPNGTLIGTATTTNTGSWGTYTTITCPVNNVKGLQNIYLVYKGAGYIGNINYFTFAESTDPTAGHGLLGNYFNGENFDTASFRRIDPNINFNWAEQSPAAPVNNDHFSVRWTGQIQPLYTGAYTFYINSDNGRRLWINNQLIIDKWINDWGTTYSGAIQLTANKMYDVKLEYFEATGNAEITLEWQSPSQPRELVPTQQLFLPPSDITSVVAAEENTTNRLQIFPNPATAKITIQSGKSGIHGIAVFDVHGRSIYQNNETFPGEASVDVSALVSGVYLVKIQTSDNYVVTGTFMK